MHRKAQAEFAIILGLLIIAVVVGYYAFSTLSPVSIQPSSLTQEQRSIISSVNDYVRDAGTSTISELYKNGGYLDGSTPALGTIDHKGLGSNIPLWQMCGNYNIPDMEQQYANGVKDHLNTKLPASLAIGGRTVTFNKQSMTVSTIFYDNKIVTSVNLPTVVDGMSLPQPYKVEVATKMGRINDFAKNFARMQADCRVLDNNLLSSLMQSTEYSRPCWIPVLGSTSRYFTFTWLGLKDCMERHIKYSLSNTVLGAEYPVQNGKIPVWALEFFPVPAVIDYTGVPAGTGVCNGGAAASSKKYDDLHVNFYFGDDDGLDRTEFAAPDRLTIRPSSGPENRFLPQRVAEYAQTYSVQYPVVVSVWDSSMRKSFKFALNVYIDNNNLGACTVTPTPNANVNLYGSSSYDDLCVSGATEDALIHVKYPDGSYASNQFVTFYGCDLGTTGSGESIPAMVPPVWGGLTVSDGINDFTECHMYSDLSNIVVTIPRRKKFTVNFNKVTVTKSGTTYTIGPGAVTTATERVDLLLTKDGNICSGPDEDALVNTDNVGAFVSQLEFTNIPVAARTVEVTSYSGNAVSGFINATGFTPAGSSFHVYAPVLSGFTPDDIDGIKAVFNACGISPASNTEYEYNGGGCSSG